MKYKMNVTEAFGLQPKVVTPVTASFPRLSSIQTYIALWAVPCASGRLQIQRSSPRFPRACSLVPSLSWHQQNPLPPSKIFLPSLHYYGQEYSKSFTLCPPLPSDETTDLASTRLYFNPGKPQPASPFRLRQRSHIVLKTLGMHKPRFARMPG